MARILGIDPGSRVTGYGIIESNGSHSCHIASGCIRTQQKAFTERLGEIFLGLQQIIEEHQPDQVAIEEVFVDKNVSSALKLGQARGAAIAAAVVAQKPVFEYTPRLVKKALVGKGQAEKEQVQHMVKVLLSLQGKFGLDESDALAIALCHAHSHTTLSSIGGR